MSDTKPTAAAMRAANSVLKCPMLNESREKQCQMIADCIDRETGLPELIAACQTLAEYWENGTPVRAGSDAAKDLLDALSKATRKAYYANESKAEGT